MISNIALRPYCGTDECAVSPTAVTLILMDPLCPVAWWDSVGSPVFQARRQRFSAFLID